MHAQVRKGRYVVLMAGETPFGSAARPTFRLAGEALALAKVESAAGPELKLHYFAPARDRPGARQHRLRLRLHWAFSLVPALRSRRI